MAAVAAHPRFASYKAEVIEKAKKSASDLLDFVGQRSTEYETHAKVRKVMLMHTTQQAKANLVGQLAQVLVERHLSSLDRQAVYGLMLQWNCKYAPFAPINRLFNDALKLLATGEEESQIRKGALHVLIAHKQQGLLYAMRKNDPTGFTTLLKDLISAGVPHHKLVKNYSPTTQEAIESKEMTCLKMWVICARLEAHRGKAEPDREIAELLKKLAFLEDESYTNTQDAIRTRTLPALYTSFFAAAQTLMKIFKGSERDAESLLAGIEARAKSGGIDVTELINFAIEHLSILGGNTSNPMIDKARTVALNASAALSEPLARDLYEALLTDDLKTSFALMQKAESLSLGPQMSCHLQKLVEGQIAGVAPNARIQQIIASYHALNQLGMHQHHMAPWELLQAASVAMRHFTKYHDPKEAYVVHNEASRAFIVDSLNHTISFLNRAKGGRDLCFGSYKQLSSAITLSQIPNAKIPSYSAKSTTVITVEKSSIFDRNYSTFWLDEVASLQKNRGLAGLLSADTAAAEILSIRGKQYSRVYAVVRHYASGDLHDMITKEVPLKNYVKYYLDLATGLKNLHTYQKTLPDGTKKLFARVHGDINPTNMLLDLDGSSVLCDFGFESCPQGGIGMPLYVPYYGTPGYSDPMVTVLALRAPEEGKSVQEALLSLDTLTLDCFAMGASMFYQLTGNLPSALIKQHQHYSQETMTLDEAIAINEQQNRNHDDATSELACKSCPTIKEELLGMAWKLMDPDHKKRMTAETFLSSMQALQGKAAALP